MKILKNYQKAFKGRPCVHIFSTIEDDYGSPYQRCIRCFRIFENGENEY